MTGGFNNGQTERLAGKNFNRQHPDAAVALLANAKGNGGLLIAGNILGVKQHTASLDKPGGEPECFFRNTLFFGTGYGQIDRLTFALARCFNECMIVTWIVYRDFASRWKKFWCRAVPAPRDCPSALSLIR